MSRLPGCSACVNCSGDVSCGVRFIGRGGATRGALASTPGAIKAVEGCSTLSAADPVGRRAGASAHWEPATGCGARTAGRDGAAALRSLVDSRSEVG